MKVSGDGVNFIKTSELRKHPFPEVDFVIPEGVIWTTIGNMLIRVHPEVLQVKEYNAPNCISFSGKMEYCRGRAYAMATTEKNLKIYPRDFKTRYWKLINFIRYSIHGEISLINSKKIWDENSLLIEFILAIPLGFMFAVKDRIQGKVIKTHRDFINAEKIVKITCNRYIIQDI